MFQKFSISAFLNCRDNYIASSCAPRAALGFCIAGGMGEIRALGIQESEFKNQNSDEAGGGACALLIDETREMFKKLTEVFEREKSRNSAGCR